MDHPYHRHPLHRVDADYTYANFNGIWACDVCRTVSSENKERYPYHCQDCSFDLCNECFCAVGVDRHPLHAHTLRKFRMCDVYEGGAWKCDQCQKVNSGECAYHCGLCNFDLCETCFHSSSHPLHEHPLLLADAGVVYQQHNGRWFCDHCRMSSVRSGLNISHHCPKCHFDLCVNCVASQQHHLHPHPLQLANSYVVYSTQLYDGQWFCDNCKRSSRGDMYMWHCRKCQFDLCMSCYSLPPPPPPKFKRVSHMPHSAMQERPIEPVRDETDPTECIICMDRPRNAGIIHGETSHVVCCLECAQKLKNDLQVCPICRMPIDKVVQQFSS